ncbi:MAG: hypothetical protein JWM98_2030 [Thermoleophilia bacterium]|nr:hypothetical protein [Thermoleophilia bacterium]
MRRTLLVTSMLLASLLSPTAAGAAPSATIGSVDCARGGTVASLATTGDAPTTFTIQRDGATVNTVTLRDPGDGRQQLVPIAEGRTSLVTVQISGAGYVSSNVTRNCGAEPVGEQVPVTAATAGQAPTTRTSARTPGELPFTGARSTRSLGLGGLALALVGAVLHHGGRRRSARRPARSAQD